MRFVGILTFLFVISPLWLAAAANACIVYNDYDEAAFIEADLIFVGNLTDYNIVTIEGEWFDQELAILTYRVNEVLKGKAGDTIQLQWWNSTFAFPATMSRYGETLVAANRDGAPERDWTGWLQYPSINALSRLPTVHQSPCSDASISPVAQSDVATVKRWITAGASDGSALSYDGFRIVDELPARRTGQVSLLAIGSGTVSGGLLAFLIWYRRRRRASARV